MNQIIESLARGACCKSVRKGKLQETTSSSVLIQFRIIQKVHLVSLNFWRTLYKMQGPTSVNESGWIDEYSTIKSKVRLECGIFTAVKIK